jgi:hypothetical protein
MIITTWTDIEVLPKLLMVDHRITTITFNPKCFRATFSRKYGVYFWSDKVGDPVHLIYQIIFIYSYIAKLKNSIIQSKNKPTVFSYRIVGTLNLIG